ncbi:MAG: phosphatase PAP2 family protein [Desulfobacterales bacterium]|nr:phosphatase PAP2 family protein [Desulfobacterales bacterium]
MRKYVFLLAIFIFTGALTSGCGTLPNGRRWGQDATLTPGWKRVRQAAVKAAVSPETWIPATCAAVLQIDDMDHRISDWATDHHPVFGDQKTAKQAGNRLEQGLAAAYIISALATPGGEGTKEWLSAKAKGILVGGTAFGITALTTNFLKDTIDRHEPNRKYSGCFPSGHASGASAFATLASKNVDRISMSGRKKFLLNTGFKALAVGTSWARVEANAHYPADVLAGYALGHFISSFIHDAFLDLDQNDDFMITTQTSKDAFSLALRWGY